MPADPIHPSQRNQQSQPYRPSPEADSRHLADWTQRMSKPPMSHSLSPIGQRYLTALALLTQKEQLAFLLTLTLASGHALPPFPDQE